MEESVPEPTVRAEQIMVVPRLAQELISQQLKAAAEQLEIIANAIREDGGAASLSLIYVSAVNARVHLDEALKELPWSPARVDTRRRAVTPPPPAG